MKSESKEEKGLLSANALHVLEKRYLLKEEGRIVESPEMLFRRVASNIAAADKLYDRAADVDAVSEAFHRMMWELRFLPNSPTLMNAGRDLQQLSACFVLPIGDSMEEIFDAIKHTAIIHKTGGGTGFSFSQLRPKNDQVRSTGGVASGPISFMKVFNHATEAVKQGGTRRGANMGILRVDHPDILEFIRCKEDTAEVVNFNISVAITDAFMRALEKGEDYPLINPRTGKEAGRLPAREVMAQITRQAHKTGEPGLFFIDRANKSNPTPAVGTIEATNPCGEQPLLPYESCNLGSVNLERHLIEEDGKYRLDWAALEGTIRSAIHFLDNVIDVNRYPLKEIEKVTKSNRKIGLGVMGFARILFKLGIPYDSELGLETARQVMGFIRDTGYQESERLAEQRGVYPNWSGSLHEERGERVRNSYITTVAPTGTISMIADTSGGCEPEFSLIWYKNVMGGEKLSYALDHFVEVAKREGFWSDDLPNQIVANHGSVRGLMQIPLQWRQLFVTAHDISPKWHVLMQAAFQESSDSAVSKTINLPPEATIQEVEEAYLLAYRLGCKGITVYRDGSRPDQVMNVGKVSTKENENGTGASNGALHWGDVLELPDIVDEKRVRVRTKDGNAYIHIAFLNGRPREIFSNPALGQHQSTVAIVGRLGSEVLRLGGSIERIAHHLHEVHREYGDIRVPLMAINGGIQKVMESVGQPVVVTEPCPECADTMRMEEGCMKCPNTACGYSRC